MLFLIVLASCASSLVMVLILGLVLEVKQHCTHGSRRRACQSITTLETSASTMDLLREYDFDCLPLIDRVSWIVICKLAVFENYQLFFSQEYDNPVVQGIVHSMIATEMRSFAPGDYLAYLPKPELKFENSSALQVMSHLWIAEWNYMLTFCNL